MRDIEYLKSLYPLEIKRMLSYVSEACDRLDYKNSPMYDEYPDRMLIDRICSTICRTIGCAESSGESDSVLFHNTIKVLLLNEMYNRRCDRRICI